MLAYRFNAAPLPISVTDNQKLQDDSGLQSPDCITGTEITDMSIAKKKKPKAKKVGMKPVGVIAAIVDLISRDKGASIKEIVAALVKKFPDRDESGMLSTSRIQAAKHATSKERDEKRGLVYYKAG